MFFSSTWPSYNAYCNLSVNSCIHVTQASLLGRFKIHQSSQIAYSTWILDLFLEKMIHDFFQIFQSTSSTLLEQKVPGTKSREVAQYFQKFSRELKVAGIKCRAKFQN